MLDRVIDRLAIAHALARCRGQASDEEPALARLLPAFAPDGTRLGDSTVGLDWSRLPEASPSSGGTAEVVRRALDALPPRYRAASLIDTEALAPADVAAGLGEPLDAVRRRLHRARMAVRERLTAHLSMAASPH